MTHTPGSNPGGATGTNPLWGGRFTTGASSLLEEINSSVHFDFRLAEQDVAGSIAHARMLVDQGVISVDEGQAIVNGLKIIAAEIAAGDLVLDRALEDVHMNIEARLHDLIGPVAGRLHTGRSRNDQVAVDTKLWVRDAIDRLDSLLADTIRVLAERAETHCADVMPGFTHLQCAQPVTVGHHLLAYGEMFLRDRDRLLDARRRLNESPLGAAALAGTSYPINPDQTAAELGFNGVFRNSLDAVSDRDFILDYVGAGATLSIHMSRLAEEIVIWSTPQFGFVTLPEDLSAGSSIMPQKRNPDAAELVRAKAGRVIGSLITLLTVLKALPLAYSRDMQEDKEALFDAADTLELCVRTTKAMLTGIVLHTKKTRADAEIGNATATDLADWLVAERGVPFRESHGIVGRVVKALEAEGRELRHADPEQLATLEPRFAGLPADVLIVDHAVARRTSPGGTAPIRVSEAAATLRKLNEQLSIKEPAK
ncbi:argininosuccinate lyase [Nocardia concava]|uniref:argininosuccinate lyase n=1 Tax=Nocardia concava TaxID=257281 RepID=UPI0006887C41|nr:argininosuccinate lyase [Nocardia concava]